MSKKKVLITLVFYIVLILIMLHGCKPTVTRKIEQVEKHLLKAVAFTREDRIGQHIFKRMNDYAVPGLSIAVIEKGKLLWTKGYGITSPHRKPKQVSKDTVFQTGSIGKMIASLAVLALVDKNVLDLDKDVNQYLRSWTLPQNKFNRDQKVTLRHLLSHRSGIGVDYSEYHMDDKIPTLTEHLKRNNYKLTKKPGMSYFYSGAGYIIIEQIIEDVTGKSYKEVASEMVLRPLGMNNTHFEIFLPDKIEGNAALAHHKNGALYEDIYPVFPCFAPGTCNWSTTEDLAKLFIGIRRSYFGESDRIIPKHLANTMVSNISDMYGLGIKVLPEGGDFLIGHSGDFYGFHACLYGYLNAGDAIVVMTNGDNGVKLYNEIIRSVARTYNWPGCQQLEVQIDVNKNSQKFQSLNGCYFLLDRLDITRIFHEEKKLMGKILGYKSELVQIDNLKFFHQGADGFFTFKKNPEGDIGSLNFKRIGFFCNGDRIPGLDLLFTENWEQGIKIVLQEKEWFINKIYLENIFISIGYSLLEQKKVGKAIEVFTLGIRLYPTAWNMYDSLGEAYGVDGQYNKSIENYRKSLEYNPGNHNAAKALKRMIKK